MMRMSSRSKSEFANCIDDIEEDDTDRLVREAVLDALRDHKQAGNPIAVWEDGKVKILQPEDIILPDDTADVSASSH